MERARAGGGARPRELVNVGTAGGLHPGMEGTHEVAAVFQHDFDDPALHAVTGEGLADGADERDRTGHGGLEVQAGDDGATGFIKRSDLGRDRDEQRPERFAVGDRVDAMITAVDKASRRVSVSIKALEMKDEQEAIEQFGSSDSGASLGDILGAALKNAGAKE